MPQWYLNLPNKVRAAIHTTWIAFIAQFGPSLFGWIHEVQEWAGDTSRSFPAVSPLGKLAAAAMVSAVAGALNFIFRSIVPAPQYQTTTTEIVPPADGDKGEVSVSLLLRLLSLVALVIFTLAGFEVINNSHPFGWLGLGLSAWLLASFVP